MIRRLIDAIPLIAELRKSAEYHENRRLGYYSAITHIKEQPTIDAVELPLKIGEKCYCILIHKNEIVEDVVDDYDIWSIKNGVKLRITLKNYNDYVIGECGETVFKTREEAEAAMERREAT